MIINRKELINSIKLVRAARFQDEGLKVTPAIRIVGLPGTGKTSILTDLEKEFDAYSLVIDGSLLKEGEIGGLPFVAVEDVKYSTHSVFRKISSMNRDYHEKIVTNSLDPSIVYNEAKKTITYNGKERSITINSWYKKDEIIDNLMILDCLTKEEQFELLNKKIIKSVFLLVDELVRGDENLTTELMNIILQREINDHRLPFYVEVIAAQNPTGPGSPFKGQKLEPAQLDRFCTVIYQTTEEEYLEYAEKTGKSEILTTTIANNSKLFYDPKLEGARKAMEIDQQFVSPRGLDVVDTYIKVFLNYKKIPGFENMTEKEMRKILSICISGKIGESNVAYFFQTIDEVEAFIKPEEIFTMKGPKLDSAIVERLKRLRANEVRWILFPRVIDYFKKEIPKIEKDKTKFELLKLQLKDFMVDSKILSETSQITFGRRIKEASCSDGKSLFARVVKCFSSDLLNVILTFENNANDMTK